MSGILSDVYIKKDTLKKMLEVLEAKNEKGISLTISTGDRTNDYGQNVSAFVSQSKEDREAKKDKFYVGNGKVFWTNIDGVHKPEKQSGADNDNSNDNELPF